MRSWSRVVALGMGMLTFGAEIPAQNFPLSDEDLARYVSRNLYERLQETGNAFVLIEPRRSLISVTSGPISTWLTLRALADVECLSLDEAGTGTYVLSPATREYQLSRTLYRLTTADVDRLHRLWIPLQTESEGTSPSCIAYSSPGPFNVARLISSVPWDSEQTDPRPLLSVWTYAVPVLEVRNEEDRTVARLVLRQTPEAPPSAFENPHFLQEFRRDRPLRRATGEFDFGAGRIMTIGAWLEEAKVLGLKIPEVESEDEDWRNTDIYVHGRFSQETFDRTLEILLTSRESYEQDSRAAERFRSRILQSVRSSLTHDERNLINRRFTGREIQEIHTMFPGRLQVRLADDERFRLHLAARVTIVHGERTVLSHSVTFRDNR